MCEAREQRGTLIAAVCKIVKKGAMWIVPSQSDGNKKYSVHPDEQQPFCSCPDFEARGCSCKHIYAVRCVIKREQNTDGTETVTKTMTVTETTTKKPTYPQMWKQYNAAQVNEKDHFQAILGSICDMIEEPNVKPGRGRPRLPMSDCVFMSCYKAYSTVAQRRFMCDLDDAKEKGYITRTPHYNAIGASLEDEAMTPVLMKLIEQSALPLQSVETEFAIDSSGFSANKFAKWVDYKHGGFREVREWVKCHVVCGVKTHVVTAALVTHRDANDCPFLPELLNKTAENFSVRELSADKQYASTVNFEAINAVGADAFVDFRATTTGGCGGLFAKCYHFCQMYKEEFFASYHKRSNVESVFSMVKRKFGDAVRSKDETAMKNEVLCKILAHNICCLISAFYELGIEPKFLST